MIITVALLATVAVLGLFAIALTLSSKREFSAANQVIPGVATKAPASWAGAHTPEAKLHRRLGAAVRAAHGIPRLTELGLTTQIARLDAEALAIDERLIAAAGLPERHRADAIEGLEPAVVALEDAVATLVGSTAVGDSRELLERVVSEADIKLQALAQARAEIEELDRAVRGSDPSATDEPGTATG